jgi:predicted HNH restriction endonuclease
MKYDDETIDSEIKKCVCLCSNCHKEFHYFYGTKPKQPEKDLEHYLREV